MHDNVRFKKTNIEPRGRGWKVRWVPRGRQRLVRSDALSQRTDKSKNKVSGEAKVMGGKVGPCRSLHPDDWIGRVVGVLRWGWAG